MGRHGDDPHGGGQDPAPITEGMEPADANGNSVVGHAAALWPPPKRSLIDRQLRGG